MSERFFLESAPQGDTVEFIEGEATHLAKVMRAKPGDLVTAFDGSGREYEVEIAAIEKKRVLGKIRCTSEVSREAACRLILAVALPKGERQRWLVEKCVELGVATLVPLITERGVAQPVEKVVERLRRAVIEASKQCGRNHLMHLTPGQRIDELLNSAPTTTARLILHPTGEPLSNQIRETPAETLALIGPEGGFSEAEVKQAKEAGCQIVSLGPRILRVETAALAIASLVTVPGISKQPGGWGQMV